MKALTALLVIGMFATAVAMADDADDVKAAEMDFRAKESAGNVDGYFAYKAPTYSIFPPTSGQYTEPSFTRSEVELLELQFVTDFCLFWNTSCSIGNQSTMDI